MKAFVSWMAMWTALAIVPLPALAVYRCDDQGNISYSDAPCPGSQRGERLASPTPTDPNQAQQEQRKLERQQQQLQRLQSARERTAAAEESARARAEAGRQAHAKRCRLLELKARWSADDAAQATLKQQAHARKSAQRKNEQYQLECGTSR